VPRHVLHVGSVGAVMQNEAEHASAQAPAQAHVASACHASAPSVLPQTIPPWVKTSAQVPQLGVPPEPPPPEPPLPPVPPVPPLPIEPPAPPVVLDVQTATPRGASNTIRQNDRCAALVRGAFVRDRGHLRGEATPSLRRKPGRCRGAASPGRRGSRQRVDLPGARCTTPAPPPPRCPPCRPRCLRRTRRAACTPPCSGPRPGRSRRARCGGWDRRGRATYEDEKTRDTSRMQATPEPYDRNRDLSPCSPGIEID
jgi:hypothetical protein